MRLSMSQETPVPQSFSLITHPTITAQSMSLRSADGGEKHVARTLSRDFWQYKNFGAHRLCDSPALAKTGFCRESPAGDSRLAISWLARRAAVSVEPLVRAP